MNKSALENLNCGFEEYAVNLVENYRDDQFIMANVQAAIDEPLSLSEVEDDVQTLVEQNILKKTETHEDISNLYEVVKYEDSGLNELEEPEGYLDTSRNNEMNTRL